MTERLPSFDAQGEPLVGMLRAIRAGQSSHAYLITGAEGIGKKTLAKTMAAMLMCQSDGERPCGKCASCYQLDHGHHPDLLWVVPGVRVDPNNASTTKSMSIDDIRDMTKIVQKRAMEASNRVVVLQGADSMLEPAQNALLKTLEEPPTHTVFLLLAEDAAALRTTIISRCRPIRLKPWQDADMLNMLRGAGVEESKAAQVLSLSDGSIGKALMMARDEQFWAQRDELVHDFFDIQSDADILRVAAAAKDYDKKRKTNWLDDLEHVVHDLRQVGLKQYPIERIAYLPRHWQRMAEEAPSALWTEMAEQICTAKQFRTSNVTVQSVLERLLLYMTEASKPWRK